MNKKSEAQVQREVLEGIKKSGSLRKFRKEKYPDVSLGTLSRISKGEFPVKQSIRDLFDLASTASVAVCPVHGIVHLGSCKLTFEQKLQLSSMPEEEKRGLVNTFQSLSLLSKLKELREASASKPPNNSPS